LSSIGFGYYVAFVFPITIEIVQSLPTATYYSALYETVFVLSLMGYVLSVILGASIGSDRLLKESNNILKSHNDTILESYKDKTVLLKEVHHRVKNNLQVIVSLMRLQMRNISENGAEESYHETINRVLTMSRIHEKIYQSESLSQVNLEKYFNDLSTDLISSYQTNFDVELEYSFKVEKVGLQTIVPLALIFNELFSNSLKHAFHQTEKPKITLFIKSLNAQIFTFTYEDNGEWKEPESGNSLGMELIDSLTSQLDGEMNFTNTPNTKYEFKFKMLDE
jgi:two-component sensor histidine kinase